MLRSILSHSSRLSRSQLLSISSAFSSKPTVTKSSEIFLYDDSGKSMGKKSLIDAEKLAKTMGMNLVISRLNIHRHKIPTYILEKIGVDDMKPISSEDKSKEGIKKQPMKFTGLKKTVINGSIGDHDLITKEKTLRKWLDNLFEVSVIVRGGGSKENIETLCKKIEAKFVDYRILQKQIKPNGAKFTLSPDPKKLDLYSSNKAASANDKHHDIDSYVDPSELNDDELNEMINEKLHKK